jgi:Sulfotransferase family
MASDLSFEEATLFIALGPPRTGSRWLTNYLTKHTEILMSPLLMLNYFTKTSSFHQYYETRLKKLEGDFTEKNDKEGGHLSPAIDRLRDRVRMNQDPDAYLEYFRKRWTSEKVFADVTPSYYAEDRDMFARMRDAHGKVRFLFVLRNPIDRFCSGLRLAEMQDTAFDPIARLDSILSSNATPWRRNYISTLTDLDAAIPTAELKVCFFEELFDIAGIGDLCTFLGVETQPADFASPLNQSEGFELDAERRGRLYAKFEPNYRYLQDRYGRLPNSWLEDMERFGV